MGEVCERINRKNKENESDLPLTISSQHGLIDQRDFFNKVVAAKDMSEYYLLQKGEFAYNKSYSNGYDYGSIKRLNSYEKGCLSTLYICFKLISDKVNSDYLECYFDTLGWYHNVSQICAEGARNHGLLNVDVKAFFTEVTVKFPVDVKEQQQISAILHYLDHLITLHQRKCDETKKLKKFMLQKMFPKNGEKNPEIRFAGFTDDWEQRKLGEWGEFYYGRSCPKWSVTEDAITPCVRYGELYTKFGSKIDEIYSYTNMPVDNLRFSKGNEVLIPRVGEDPMDYNHCTWLSIPGVAIGEMISVFNTTQSPLFSAIMFNATLQREFAMRVEGGSVTNLYYDKLKNIDVLYPTMEEQKEIARYFSTLDHLITLHQRK